MLLAQVLKGATRGCAKIAWRGLCAATLVVCASLSAIAAPTDVILVLDNSGSMRQNDPNFLLKRAVSKFVTELQQDTRVGMIIFDQKVAYPIPLDELNVESRGAIQSALEAVDYRGQLTNSPAAIERAIYELKSTARDAAAKVIIFMTDGIVDTGDAEADNEKTKWMREELAADAADSGIKVFGIAFTENADFFLIQSLAKKTNGEYFRALTPEDLVGVFSSVHSKLAEPPPPPVVVPAPVVQPPPTATCLDGLVAEERAMMEESAPGAGMTAEELCREMMAPMPDDTQTVGPAQVVIDEDETIGLVVVIAVAGIVLLLVVIVVVLLLRRGRAVAPPDALAPAPVPDAFINDVNNITGDVATKIGSKPLLIGRVAGTDPAHLDYFVVDKGTIGRRHALIQYRDYSFWVADQGSVNGTFLNGERIENERQLKHGDRVKFHKYEFEFSMPEMDDAGHTVFADPNDPAMIGEATMIGSIADSADHDGDMTAEVASDDVFEGATALPPSAAQDSDDDLFDDATSLSARSRADALAGDDEDGFDVDDDDEEVSTGADVFGDEDATSQPQSAFDAEASAFFDEDALAQTNDPMAMDDLSEEPTAMPQNQSGPEEEDSSESSTLRPGEVYADDELNATADISLDEFMQTDSFEVPLPGIDEDDSEDATLMPEQVAAPRDSQPAIDDVFDITGDRTIPPGAPLADDDDDDDEDSESPTKFHS